MTHPNWLYRGLAWQFQHTGIGGCSETWRRPSPSPTLKSIYMRYYSIYMSCYLKKVASIGKDPHHPVYVFLTVTIRW